MMTPQEPEDLYYFWEAPINGLPEFTSGAHGVTIIPGMRQFVLLHATVRRPIPADAIPASDVHAFLRRLAADLRSSGTHG